MSFNKPNDPAAGVNPAPTATQSLLDSIDLAVLAAGSNKTGVISGCAVTERGAGANMSVDVAAGIVSVKGNTVNVTAVNKTISANASGNPRLDLICVSSAGAVTVVAGATATAPDYPLVAIDTDGNLLRAILAVVYVPSGASSVTTAANITDLRVFVNFGDLLCTDTVNTDTTHVAWTLTDNTDFSHTQTGGVDSYAAQEIIGSPTVDASKTLPFYNGLWLASAPTVGSGGQISQHVAVNMQWDAPAGVTTPMVMGMLAHVGVVGGTVTKMRGIHVELQHAFGAIQQGTGFYFMASMAQKTFGLKVGGTNGNYTDHWPTFHMGPISMGGTPAATTDGALFNPAAMLDIREIKQLVYTVKIVTHNGTTAIEVDSSDTVGTFDYLFDSGAAITGTGIPGGTTLTSVSPTSAVLSAAATADGTAITATITKVVTDQNSSAIRFTPQYDGAATVTRHNYMRFNRPVLTNSAAVTQAFAFHFPNAVGIHEALASGTTKTTPSGVDGWLSVNVAGTPYYVPMYTSKTA